MNDNLRPRTMKRRIHGFDRAIGELNAVLFVLAIGLAALDATCFIAFQIRDALPSPAVASSHIASVTTAGRAQSGQVLAAMAPSRPAVRPAVTATGW